MANRQERGMVGVAFGILLQRDHRLMRAGNVKMKKKDDADRSRSKNNGEMRETGCSPSLRPSNDVRPSWTHGFSTLDQ